MQSPGSDHTIEALDLADLDIERLESLERDVLSRLRDYLLIEYPSQWAQVAHFGDEASARLQDWQLLQDISSLVLFARAQRSTQAGPPMVIGDEALLQLLTLDVEDDRSVGFSGSGADTVTPLSRAPQSLELRNLTQASGGDTAQHGGVTGFFGSDMKLHGESDSAQTVFFSDGSFSEISSQPPSGASIAPTTRTTMSSSVSAPSSSAPPHPARGLTSGLGGRLKSFAQRVFSPTTTATTTSAGVSATSHLGGRESITEKKSKNGQQKNIAPPLSDDNDVDLGVSHQPDPPAQRVAVPLRGSTVPNSRTVSGASARVGSQPVSPPRPDSSLTPPRTGDPRVVAQRRGVLFQGPPSVPVDDPPSSDDNDDDGPPDDPSEMPGLYDEEEVSGVIDRFIAGKVRIFNDSVDDLVRAASPYVFSFQGLSTDQLKTLMSDNVPPPTLEPAAAKMRQEAQRHVMPPNTSVDSRHDFAVRTEKELYRNHKDLFPAFYLLTVAATHITGFPPDSIEFSIGKEALVTAHALMLQFLQRVNASRAKLGLRQDIRTRLESKDKGPLDDGAMRELTAAAEEDLTFLAKIRSKAPKPAQSKSDRAGATTATQSPPQRPAGGNKKPYTKSNTRSPGKPSKPSTSTASTDSTPAKTDSPKSK